MPQGQAGPNGMIQQPNTNQMPNNGQNIPQEANGIQNGVQNVAANIQIPQEALAKLVANARNNPAALNQLSQLLTKNDSPAGAAAQKELLMRLSQQVRAAPQNAAPGPNAAQAQLINQARLLQAQTQQALGNGGAPVQAQPKQNPNGTAQAQQNGQNQPLQVQAGGKMGTGNGNSRGPLPGPIAIPGQGQAHMQSQPVQNIQPTNIPQPQLEQRLNNIMANLDVFIQKKDNNELDAEHLRLVSSPLSAKSVKWLR
jgi:hypothetical protein